MNDPRGIPPEAFREGRVDEVFYFGLPSRQARIDIVKIHFGKRLKSVDLTLADLGFDEEQWHEAGDLTEHWLPGELEGLVKRSKSLAFRNGKRAIPTFDEVLEIIQDRAPHIDFIKQRDKLLELQDACKDAQQIDYPDSDGTEVVLAGGERGGLQPKGLPFEEE